MYQHILIPYDGSDEADLGVEHGIELAAELDATVHALYVIDLPDTPRTVYYTTDDDEQEERFQAYADEILGDVCEWAEAAGVTCEMHVTHGRPGPRIADFAEEEGMDLIVMGSAYTGSLRTLLGGTTDKVVRTATVPVLTYRGEE
ncbi:MAG: universal stress protein [Haloarculaceae archaeon]